MVAMKPKRTKLTDQLRAAIEGSGKSRYQISLETGVDAATLCRFMKCKGGLSVDGLDKLGDCLGLELRAVKMPPAKKGR